jgi:hypothetical protein
MKKIISLVILPVGISHAQLAVTDAAAITRSTIQHIETVAKQINQIQNQVEQINQIKNQVTQATKTNNLIGEFGGGDLRQLRSSLENLENIKNVKSLNDVVRASRSASSIASYDGGGIFGEFKQMPENLSEEDLKKYGANQSAYDNFRAVSDDAKNRNTILADEKKRALERAASATTMAERDNAMAAAKAAQEGIENNNAAVAAAGENVQAVASATAVNDQKETELLLKKIDEVSLKERDEQYRKWKELNSKLKY